MQAVEQQIRAFIQKNFFSSDAFTDEDSLFQKGIVDSTGVLEVVAFVEETFKVKVKDQDLVPDNFETIARLARYVRAQTGA